MAKSGIRKYIFDLNAATPSHFYKGQWDPSFSTTDPSPILVDGWYLTFRFVMFLIFLIAFIVNVACNNQSGLFLIFFTNWGQLIQVAFTTLYFLRLLGVWLKQRRRRGDNVNIEELVPKEDGDTSKGPGKLPWPEKVIWVLLDLCCTAPYVVTLGYWGVVHPGIDYTNYTTCRHTANILVHGINSPLFLLDFMIMAIPVRPTHLVFPAILGLAYTSFTGLYEVAGGSYPPGRESIYGFLNWRSKPVKALIASFVALIAAGLFHYFLGYWLYRLKSLISRRLGGGVKIGTNNNNVDSLGLDPGGGLSVITIPSFQPGPGGPLRSGEDDTLGQRSVTNTNAKEEDPVASLVKPPDYNTFSTSDQKSESV